MANADYVPSYGEGYNDGYTDGYNEVLTIIQEFITFEKTTVSKVDPELKRDITKGIMICVEALEKYVKGRTEDYD